jgi:long-chain acyl-CoA synthetase
MDACAQFPAVSETPGWKPTMNIIELSEKNRQSFGEYTSLIFQGRHYTNIEMDAASARLVYWLTDRGIAPGDRVATLLSNCPEILSAYAAIFKAGAVAVPLMFLLQSQEIAYILQNCQPTAIVTSVLHWPKVSEALLAAPLGDLRAILIVEEDAPEGTQSMVPILRDGPRMEGWADRDEDDLAVLIYTSGTTGNPKGVMQTHKNLRANADAYARRAREDGSSPNGEISLNVLPLAHAYGMLLLTAGYQFQTTTVLLPRFSPKDVLEAIERYRVISAAFVPTMVTLLLHFPEAGGYDASSLLRVRCGSAPLSMATLRAFEKKFGCTVYMGYGLTETGGWLSAHRVGRPIKPASAGIPLENVTLRIVDDQDRELPAKQLGEIVACGPNVMKGYYRMPEATLEAMRGGWFHTGDIGYLDEEGYLYIADRKKDLIIRGGFNILPADVEEVLMRHPAVMECAVIGVKDEIMGEEVKACVVLAGGYVEGENASAEEIIAFCRQQMSHHKAPKAIEFMSSLPRSATGKVLKKELRRLAGSP